MKVSKLIERLKLMDQDAEVMMHEHKEHGGDDILFVLCRMNDPKCVWLESKKDCDFPYQLGEAFDAMHDRGDTDLLSFYTDLLDRGVTIDEVKEHVGEEEASRMKQFCEENGLV